ncbi:MAG: DUF4125 family protein [Lachnospiraceae bacterium]
MNREELIQHILEEEWEMFTTVNNRGGRADCQDDRQTFAIMRVAQLSVWNEEVLVSYLLDLLEAKEAGRNLMTEKYAHIMEKTYPEEYEQIKNFLLPVSDYAKLMVETILKIYTIWEKEFSKKYPRVRKRGRTDNINAAITGEASVEDYQYGELMTYSERTLRAMLECIGEAPDKNLYIEELSNMIKPYGFKTIEEAEESLKR